MPLSARLAFLALVLLVSPALGSAAEWGPIEILEVKVEPGTRARLEFFRERSFMKGSVDAAVLVARGASPGPTLCLIGAIHGDEINGVEIARHVEAGTDPKTLSGTVVAIPIVNVWGFRSKNRYLADRRDLNRAFPGHPTGSTAGMIAYGLFERVIRHCQYLVDLHTGSNERTNLPQIRVDLENEGARGLALAFNVGVVLGGAGPSGSLRRAAVEAGIPSIIYESGGPNRFEKHEIEQGIVGVTNVMKHLRMLPAPAPEPDLQRVYRVTSWVRSSSGGIFLTDRQLGDKIEKGNLLGTVTDPDTSELAEVRAPYAGTLIGMAYPQFVLPGYGLFHFGRSSDMLAPEEPEEDIAEDAE